jgi:hypothetical protein
MKKYLVLTVINAFIFINCSAQSGDIQAGLNVWTENDRAYLLSNLARSRDELINETKGLSDAQWNFKESPDRWSIKEVTEHICYYELLFMHEISKALSAGVQADLNITARPDSSFSSFIMEEKPHVSVEYTKPFTYSLPMGLNEGKNNVAWFLKMRNESIGYLKSATENLRSYFLKKGRGNVHQVYIYVFGHTDRHLRQIRKIKANAGYPKGR